MGGSRSLGYLNAKEGKTTELEEKVQANKNSIIGVPKRRDREGIWEKRLGGQRDNRGGRKT